MTKEGWTATAVDLDANAFSRLPAYLSVSSIVGNSLELEVMKMAGAEKADVLVAATPKDDLNVVIGVIARRMFAVKHAVARIRDPKRAESFRLLGLETVCSTTLEATGILRHIEQVVQVSPMNVTIAGCDHLGSYLADLLSRVGHRVVLIDRCGSSFENLHAEFGGACIKGEPTDPSVLARAKVGESDLVLAATHDDNANLMIALLAKRVLGSKEVVARVHDPRREAVYESLGIETVSPTVISADVVLKICSSLRVIMGS